MTTIYLASYVTIGDYECVRDDHGYDSMADQAHPNVCCVALSLDRAFEDAKRQLIEELIDVEEVTDAEGLDFIQEDQWNEAITTYRIDDGGTYPLASIVIHRMEMIDE